MFARVNCGLSGDCIFDALLVHHLRILNWLVVNSPGAKGITPDLRRDGDSQIS
jgi:hypothetical protein